MCKSHKICKISYKSLKMYQDQKVQVNIENPIVLPYDSNKQLEIKILTD